MCLAVMVSYELVAMLGTVYTPLSGSLPFLVLGLGVDDAIAGEFKLQRKDDVAYDTGQMSACPWRSAREHHVAVYAAIRSTFLECLREFAPRHMQQLDIEDICNAYVDAQKRFLCDDNHDEHGGNSDCWAIYSETTSRDTSSTSCLSTRCAD